MAVAEQCLTEQLASYGPQVRAIERPSPLQAAAYCRDLARSHYENFSVASWLLPRALRQHFYAVYAYCRWADDLADETRHADRSLVLLDWWEDELDRCYRGEADHPVFVALRTTIAAFDIPREPFQQLLAAFRQDQHQTRYATHAEVLGYCRNSANPVGRLVLYLGRAHDERLGAWADSICTGLQLANFCQDVARDWNAGRVYLPHETLTAAGCFDDAMVWGQATPAFRRALKTEVDRAEDYLRAGEPLVDAAPALLRRQLALFIEGGQSTLEAIRRRDYDVWTQRPTVSRWRKLRLVAECWWRNGRSGTEAAR